MVARGKALVIAGGLGHPLAPVAECLAAHFAALSIDVEATDDLICGAERLRSAPPDLLVMGPLRWRMLAERYDDVRAEWACSTPPELESAVTSWVASGRPLLGLHTAVVSFDDWEEWGEILGGRWMWGRSHHPPIGPVRVEPRGGHPIVRGLEPFVVMDECYSELALTDDVEVLAEATIDGHPHPAVWVRTTPGVRVVVDALGHDARSLDEPSHVRLLERAVRWLLRPRQQE